MDREKITQVLQQVIDPEVGINIVDLGLVYGIEVTGQTIHIEVTMTSAACPLGSYITEQTSRVLRQAFPDRDIRVDLVWTPAWTPERMSPDTRKQLGWD